MPKPILTGFSQITPMIVQQYERYLPTAFDESMTMLEKVNKIINHLNDVGQLTNDVVAQWNTVMEWIINEGIAEDVNAQLTAKIKNGDLDSIINDNLFNDLNTRVTAKAEKSQADSIQTQVNNLVLGAVGDGNNAEVVQARGTFAVVNDRFIDNEKKIDVRFGDLLKYGVPVVGLYNSDGKTATEGTYSNWYRTPLIKVGNGDIFLHHDKPIAVRVNYYRDNLNLAGDFISREIANNGKMTFPAGTKYIGINFQLPNSNPYVSTLTIFDDVTDLLKTGIYQMPNIIYNAFTSPKIESVLKGKKWVIDGDSNSEVNATATKKYHDLIVENTGVLVSNYAKSGSGYLPYNPDGTVRQPIHTRISSYIAEADYITILAGGNNVSDIHSGTYPLGQLGDTNQNATYYGALDYTFKTLIAKYPTKKIGALSQFKRGNHVDKEQTIQNMVKALKDVCGYYGIPVLDLYNGGNIHAQNADFVAQVMPDNVHINNKGHELIATKIQTFLESL